MSSFLILKTSVIALKKKKKKKAVPLKLRKLSKDKTSYFNVPACPI